MTKICKDSYLQSWNHQMTFVLVKKFKLTNDNFLSIVPKHFKFKLFNHSVITAH